MDPLETLAIGGLTILIQPIVLGCANFTDTYVNNIQNVVSGFTNQFSDTSDEKRVTKGSLQLASGLSGILGMMPVIGQAIPQFREGSEALAKSTGSQRKDINKTLYSYLIAFVIAFIIMRYGAEILKSLGGINGIVGLIGAIA
jgi:hypothetical protein